MGWFRSEKDLEIEVNTFELDSIHGKIMFASNIEIEDEGEFVTLVAQPFIELVVEDKKDK